MTRLPILLVAAALVLSPGGRGQPKGDLPRVPPKSPADALKAFEVAPGFRVELVAAEPLVQSPVACDWDEDGNLYVAELPEYNAYAATKPQGKGRIVKLTDKDGDGTLDTRTVLAADVAYPTGLICWNGGVYVGAAPELLYFKDTDGDGKTDVRQVVLTGFGTDKAGEGQLNSFRWTLDNRILISTGLDGGDVKKKDGRTVSVRNANVLLDPKTNDFEVTSGGGQHGMTIDDFGRVYVSGNSDPIHHLAYDTRYLPAGGFANAPPAAINVLPTGKFTKLKRISEVEPWRVLRTQLRKDGKISGSDEGGTPSGFFTGATGVTVYRGDAFPPEFRGDAFVGEVANNLVFRAKLKLDGQLPVAERADPEREFLASRDVWFRPVQFAQGPDGCLTLLDMYRELIEGAAFLAPEVLKNVDPSAGFDKGRIWRIVPEGYKPRPAPRLSEATSAELVALLEHPNSWHRDTASRLLFQKGPLADEIRKTLTEMATKGKTPQARLHALHALAPLAFKNDKLLSEALADPDANVRRHALRLAEHKTPTDVRKDLAITRVWGLRSDPDPAVRRQLAFSLRDIRPDRPDAGDRAIAAVYVALAFRDLADPVMRTALLSRVGDDHVGEVLTQLATSQSFRGMPDGPAFILAMTELAAANETGTHANLMITTLQTLARGSRTTRPDPVLARAFLRVLRTRGSVATQGQFDDENNATSMKILGDFLLADAVTTAKDVRRPDAHRIAAIKDLPIAPYREVASVLAEALRPTQPPAVQAAAVEALGNFGDESAPTLIVDAWPSMTPPVRATATEVMLGRHNWTTALLDAIEAGKVARADIDPARAALLRKSAVRTIGVRATKLFAPPAARQKVFEQYRAALSMKGDPAKGKSVFKANCAACHKLEGVGEDVGADLKAVGDRGLESVLLNIIDPNREVKPQFLAYSAEMKNMRVVTGLVVAETPAGLTIRRADGTSESVARKDVESLRSLGTSYMPDGIEKQVTVEAMADLLAYLASVK